MGAWIETIYSSNYNTTGYLPLNIYSDGLDLTGAGRDSGTVAVRNIFNLIPYAKGQRPASPKLGDIILIDGDDTTDSLLVYMGGAWKLLKE